MLSWADRQPRGCGHCRDCRDGAPRFCPQRTLYGSATSSENPPHLFGGLADCLYVNPDAELFKVGDAMSDEAAVLCGSVMANGYQWAVLHGGVTFGDTVLIQGPGQQGLACTWAARAAGAARILVSGTAADADRLALARRWGADGIIDADAEDVVETVADETGGAMADVVVDVSGSPDALASSVTAVRKRGTLVLGGLVGGRQVPVEIDALVWNEIRVQGAFTAGSPALTATIELIESTGFPVADMISHTFGLDDTERCIRAIGNEINGLMKDATGRTPVHDHGHAWVAYGLLEGAETVLRYQDPTSQGSTVGGRVEPGEQISLATGQVDLVPPWTFHAEQADTERTVAVMVRSARVGKFAHRRLNPDTGETHDHPGPHQIPYQL